jgi:hypothetical protein
MLCDIEVQDTPTVVTDDEKAIERAEGDRRNSEEVHRGNRFPVLAEEGKPSRFERICHATTMMVDPSAPPHFNAGPTGGTLPYHYYWPF